jgi:hypothetical protein
MLHRWLPVFGLFLQLSSFAQVDQKKLDSLARSIDASARAARAWQDSFMKTQDSIYGTGVVRSKEPERNGFEKSAAVPKPEKKQKRTYIPVVIGIFVALVLIVGFRRKIRKPPPS